MRVFLVIKLLGNDALAQSKSKDFKMNKWYRFKCSYDSENIRFYIQSDNIREQKLFFKATLKGISRGSMGFATKGRVLFNELGNENFVISGIKVEKFEGPPREDNDNFRITWKSAFNKMGAKDRIDYCTDLFVDDKIQINRCARPHIFCHYKCDSLISPIMGIVNYSCFQDCVRETKVEGVIDPNKVEKKEAPPVNFMTWVPTLNAKCDYKPDGLKTFVNCVVKGLTEDGTKKFAKVEYKTTDGTARTVNVEYPNVNLLECGKGLTVRKDCDK